MDYLEANNILSCKQYVSISFRPKNSTYHPMLNLTNKAFSALNSKNHMIVKFCDLKKASVLLNVVRDPEEMNSNSLYKKPARSSLACPKSTHVNANSQ
jgi:hypothetical protein